MSTYTPVKEPEPDLDDLLAENADVIEKMRQTATRPRPVTDALALARAYANVIALREDLIQWTYRCKNCGHDAVRHRLRHSANAAPAQCMRDGSREHMRWVDAQRRFMP